MQASRKKDSTKGKDMTPEKKKTLGGNHPPGAVLSRLKHWKDVHNLSDDHIKQTTRDTMKLNYQKSLKILKAMYDPDGPKGTKSKTFTVDPKKYGYPSGGPNNGKKFKYKIDGIPKKSPKGSFAQMGAHEAKKHPPGLLEVGAMLHGTKSGDKKLSGRKPETFREKKLNSLMRSPMEHHAEAKKSLEMLKGIIKQENKAKKKDWEASQGKDFRWKIKDYTRGIANVEAGRNAKTGKAESKPYAASRQAVKADMKNKKFKDKQ